MAETDLQEKVSGIPTVTEPVRDRLSERQLADYHDHRAAFLRWMLNLGKSPDEAEGYAQTTVEDRAYRSSLFYRWVWDEHDGYTTNLTHDHADAFVKHLAYSDRTQDDKASLLKAVKSVYKWRQWEFGADEWEADTNFSHDTTASNPQDYLTRDERKQVREAALEYGSIPAYNSLTPEERGQWRIHLAQRFEKPKSEVGPADFKRANSWKIPSLFWTLLDTGLRGKEVEKARVQWVDVQNRVLRIPKEDSTKNRDNWIVSITERTANALDRWLHERSQYEKYDGRDALWLNREGNPYKHYSLNRILRDLCDIAGIDYENRQMTAYSIRHSVGTWLTREEGLAAAQAQLRHKSEQTTMRYDAAPPDDRRDALDRMG